MASRWWSASMLLASLMSLYWMTSSAQPHVPLTADLSQPYRVRRDLPEDTRENVQASAQVVKDTLTVAVDIFQLEAVQKASGIIGKISNCVSLVPGIGGLVSSVISVVLAFIPQDDPVLKAVKEGFAEVNRKLDSLSIQISDLAKDVEWFNYISIYSQDERLILNAWRRFTEFPKNRELLPSEKDQQQLKQEFISYYENTGADNSMNNLYHYLTATQTSLSANINELLKQKFKCDVGQISRYNLYLSSLLWKGMVVNQFYLNLKHSSKGARIDEHTKMFKKVTEAQISTIEFCLDKYADYMKNDVIETAKTISQNEKQVITVRVKKILDQKYNWYSWVVLVYDKSNEKNILLYNMTQIPVGDIIVAVGYTQKAEGSEGLQDKVKELSNKCFKEKDCMLLEKLPKCEGCDRRSRYSAPCSTTLYFEDHGKIAHVVYGDNYKVEPEPFHKVLCYWKGYQSTIFINYSRKVSVCTDKTCKKNGKCERLLNSNERWCKCHDGYYGDTCEKKMMF